MFTTYKFLTRNRHWMGQGFFKSKCSRSSCEVLEGLRQTGVVVGKEIRKLVRGGMLWEEDDGKVVRKWWVTGAPADVLWLLCGGGRLYEGQTMARWCVNDECQAQGRTVVDLEVVMRARWTTSIIFIFFTRIIDNIIIILHFYAFRSTS